MEVIVAQKSTYEELEQQILDLKREIAERRIHDESLIEELNTKYSSIFESVPASIVLLDKNGQITCKDIYSHLEKGDKLAKKITEKTAEALGILCVNLLHTTEPQRIVFTGGMIAAGDILLDRIKYYFKQHIWSLKAETVEICFAVLGENAGIIGAAALAHNMSEK